MRTSPCGATLGTHTGRTVGRSRRSLADALRIAVQCPEGAGRTMRRIAGRSRGRIPDEVESPEIACFSKSSESVEARNHFKSPANGHNVGG